MAKAIKNPIPVNDSGWQLGGDCHSIQLATGRLDIRVDRTLIALNDLCDFASRRNPKRGFLFVSKVLGKHIPVRPTTMRSAHALIASQIPRDLPGPVVFIGMAETAIHLGHGVFEQYARRTGREDILFTHSTRYRLDHHVALEFLEEHCHAADHIIYQPQDPVARAMFQNARSLVLVDDEASTGKTLVNLTNAFKTKMPSLDCVVTAMLTDWRGEQRRSQTHASMPVPAMSVAILEGQYEFSPAPNLVAVPMPQATGNGAFKDAILPRNYGRLGLLWQPDDHYPTDAASRLGKKMMGGEKTLVLGTGEFAYPPFRLAETLEAQGGDVWYQTTTRSPIMTGGAIATAISFQDNYDDGIQNYVYNVRPDQYRRVLVCHETPAATLDPQMIKALGADNVQF